MKHSEKKADKSITDMWVIVKEKQIIRILENEAEVIYGKVIDKNSQTQERL